MSNMHANNEFNSIIKDYMNEEVLSLGKIPHHNSNRLNHSLKVSYYSYLITKKLKLDYRSTAIGGLLHDMYFNRVADMETKREKIKLFTSGHPKDALANASNIFDLNNLQKNIIVSHMWPLSKELPKYKESFVVSIVDKCVSTKEFGNKWHVKVSNTLGVYFILLVNLIFR